MIDMDQVEDFYEALSAAIESGLDTPGAHAVSDMYRAAIARAEAAEARADEMEVDRDNWKARADAAEYEVMARPGIDKQFQELNDELIATRAQLDTLQEQLDELNSSFESAAAAHQELESEAANALSMRDCQIAELEMAFNDSRAQLAALKAAGEWRPVTEPPTNSGTVEAIVPIRCIDGGWWIDEGLWAPVDIPASLIVEWRHPQPAPPTEAAQ